MHEYAEIKAYKETKEGTTLIVNIPGKELGEYIKRFSIAGIVKSELRLDDGRTISADQRKKIYATIKDISLHTGHLPEELKELMKYNYMIESGEDYFSLSDCSMTTARLFINHLIEFCFVWDIPIQDSLLDRTDDIGKALWLCLKHKKCVLCGKPADIHHVQAIGMGTDRKTYDDSKHEKIALCREHHSMAHQIGWITFSKKYHVYGIKFED